MRFIHATYNMLHNSIDVTTFDGYILRIDYSKAEEGLKNNALLRMCLKCFGNRQSPWIRNTVSWGRYAEMDRCGRFIRIVVTYFHVLTRSQLIYVLYASDKFPSRAETLLNLCSYIVLTSSFIQSTISYSLTVHEIKSYLTILYHQCFLTKLA